MFRLFNKTQYWIRSHSSVVDIEPKWEMCTKWQSHEQCAFVSSALFKQCFCCQDHAVSETNMYHSSVIMKMECYTFIKQRTLSSLPFFNTQMKHRNTLLLFSRKSLQLWMILHCLFHSKVYDVMSALSNILRARCRIAKSVGEHTI